MEGCVGAYLGATTGGSVGVHIVNSVRPLSRSVGDQVERLRRTATGGKKLGFAVTLGCKDHSRVAETTEGLTGSYTTNGMGPSAVSRSLFGSCLSAGSVPSPSLVVHADKRRELSGCLL